MKRNLLYLAILSILILLAVLLNKSKENSQKYPKKSQVKIFQLNSKTINKIELQSGNQKIVCERINNIWRIISPRKLLADQEAIARFIKVFTHLTPKNSYSKNELSSSDSEFTLKLKEFGLLKPNTSYTMWSNLKKYSILKGKRAPAFKGVLYYAKTNYTNQVYTISKLSRLNLSMQDLRSKDFLNIKENELIDVKINNILFVKSKDHWLLDSAKKSDFNKIEKVINDILNIRAVDFIEKMSEKMRIPFDKKSIPVLIRSKSKAIILSVTKHNSQVYVKMKGQSTIYEITPYDIYDSLIKEKAYYLSITQ